MGAVHGQRTASGRAPIEKKSASRASSGAMSAAEGTSIMMPISTGAAVNALGPFRAARTSSTDDPRDARGRAPRPDRSPELRQEHAGCRRQRRRPRIPRRTLPRRARHPPLLRRQPTCSAAAARHLARLGRWPGADHVAHGLVGRGAARCARIAERVRRELGAAPVEIGIMIEVPRPR